MNPSVGEFAVLLVVMEVGLAAAVIDCGLPAAASEMEGVPAKVRSAFGQKQSLFLGWDGVPRLEMIDLQINWITRGEDLQVQQWDREYC